jgi:hypothetical protein
MRCLTPGEVVGLYGQIGLSVTPNPGLNRMALVLDPKVTSQQTRVGGRPTIDANRLAHIAEAVNRWHSTNTHRLLWVDHWNSDFPSTYDLFMAARFGLGETRSLTEAPGHYFDPLPYGERDQTRIPPEQAKQTGILIGLMSLMMINRWDGWLITDGSSDRIEFWEGNIFFYSNVKSRLADANSLMDQFHCSQDLS